MAVGRAAFDGVCVNTVCHVASWMPRPRASAQEVVCRLATGRSQAAQDSVHKQRDMSQPVSRALEVPGAATSVDGRRRGLREPTKIPAAMILSRSKARLLVPSYRRFATRKLDKTMNPEKLAQRCQGSCVSKTRIEGLPTISWLLSSPSRASQSGGSTVLERSSDTKMVLHTETGYQ